MELSVTGGPWVCVCMKCFLVKLHFTQNLWWKPTAKL